MTLEAVHDAAVADALAEAETLRSAAREHAEQVLAAARAEAAALLADGRAGAGRLADLEEGERLAEARAHAGAIVLSAQRTVLMEAMAAARAAARRLIGDPGYDALMERLAADARRRLRGAGPVRIVPVEEGGFVARAGTQQIDYSLDVQVERCLEAMAGELEHLWR